MLGVIYFYREPEENSLFGGLRLELELQLAVIPMDC
jgi:hypothetical protein